MKAILLVALGGALGSVGRYKLSGWLLHHAIDWKFPIGTFTVNVVGCLAAGVFAGLAEKHELQKKATVALFDEFFAAITKSLKKGERVRVGDLGILQVRKRAARMGRNPQTGEPIKIKASKKVAFRASKVLKEAI